MMRPGVSLKPTELTAVFKHIDTDNSGVVSAVELAKAMGKCGMSAKPAMLNVLHCYTWRRPSGSFPIDTVQPYCVHEATLCRLERVERVPC